MIHDISDIERTLRLSDDITHHGISDKLPEFRCEIWDDFSFFSLTHLSIRIIPPGFYDRIFESSASLSLKVIIGKESDNIRDGSSLWIVHECETAIAEIVLDTWAEYLTSKEFYHDIRRISDYHLLLIVIGCFEHIESHRSSEVSRVEVYEVISSCARDISDELFREVSVWVEYREPTSLTYVLTCHRREDR